MSSSSKSKIVPMLAVLAVLVVTLVLMRTCRRAPGLPDETLQVADALTAAAVQEATTLAGAGGDIVLVGIDLPPEMIGPFSARYIASFKNAAAKAGLTIKAEERMPPSPNMESTGEVFPKDALFGVLSKHANAKLIVFFVPLPPLTPADAARIPAQRPKVMLVTNWQALHLRTMPKGFVQTAIVPRTGETPSGVGEMDFAAQFQIIK